MGHARCERGTDALHMCHPGVQFFVEELKKDVMVVREEDLPRIATFRPPFEIDPPVQANLEWWDANTKTKLQGAEGEINKM